MSPHTRLVRLNRVRCTTDSSFKTYVYRKPAFGSSPPLPADRLLMSSISLLVIMTEHQVDVPVESCYQVQCDKCGKTSWKVGFFRCALSL